jgi:hypothetical protein
MPLELRDVEQLMRGDLRGFGNVETRGISMYLMSLIFGERHRHMKTMLSFW